MVSGLTLCVLAASGAQSSSEVSELSTCRRLNGSETILARSILHFTREMLLYVFEYILLYKNTHDMFLEPHIERARRIPVSHKSQPRGYSVTVESRGDHVDRELLHIHMEEYGMIKDIKIGRDSAIVTFYDEECAKRAWRCFEGPVRLASSPPLVDHRQSRWEGDSCRSRSRSRSNSRGISYRRRAVSSSPVPKKEIQGFGEERVETTRRVMRERSRSLQQLVGSIDMID